MEDNGRYVSAATMLDLTLASVCSFFEQLQPFLVAFLVTTNVWILFTKSKRKPPPPCYDSTLQMLADEQGDWFIEHVLQHELERSLPTTPKILKAPLTN